MYKPVLTETVSSRQPLNPMKAYMNRYATMLAGIMLALMLAAVGIPGLAVAQEAPLRSELSAETLIEAARAALAKGELEDAEFLLRGIKPGEGNADDLDFLRGSIAMAREDWQTAIARFRAMLIRDPTLPRVRLDLALAYFRAKERTAALHIISARRSATRICHLSCAPGPWRFSIRSAAARPGRSVRRSHSPPTAISTPRPARGRSTCSAFRPNSRRTRGKPAGWA